MPTSLARSDEKPNLRGNTRRRRKTASLKEQQLSVVFSFCVFPQTAAVCTTPHFARLICFRYDRRDVVTTRSVRGHLCPTNGTAQKGVVGNEVFSHPREAVRYFETMTCCLLTAKSFFFKRSSNLSQDSSKNNKTIVFPIYNETSLCLPLYRGFKFTCL